MSIFSIFNHPCSLMVYCYLRVFFYLSQVLFSGYLQFQGNFVDGQNNSKYRKILTYLHVARDMPVGKAYARLVLNDCLLAMFCFVFHISESINPIPPVSSPPQANSTSGKTRPNLIFLKSRGSIFESYTQNIFLGGKQNN